MNGCFCCLLGCSLCHEGCTEPCLLWGPCWEPGSLVRISALLGGCSWRLRGKAGSGAETVLFWTLQEG